LVEINVKCEPISGSGINGQSSLYTQLAWVWTANSISITTNIPTAMLNTAITVTLLVERELLALDAC
jgi:hypothetical protein